MRNTREIDVWIDNAFYMDMRRYDTASIYQKTLALEGKIKAKLIVEMPEKKIEVTESELRRVMKSNYSNGDSHINNYSNRVIDDLFNKEEAK